MSDNRQVSGDCVLAIDLGTSGPKVAVVTLDAEVLGWQTRPVPLALLPGGGAEQDPADWWSAICGAARGVLEQTGAAARVVAVSVTCHWCGVVAVDAQGTPLRPSIIWMDSRGARYMPELVGGLIRVEGYGVRKLVNWIRRTGGAPSLAGKEPVAHLQWLRHNEPEVLDEAAMLLEPKDWLNHRLTGVFASTYDAIATLWSTNNRDLSKVAYEPKLLDWIGVPREKLPDLCAATDVVGKLTAEAAEALGLPAAGVPVMGGTPDVQSAAVGSGAVLDGQAHIYVGTSSWVTCHVDFKKTDLFHNMASLPSALPGRYFIGTAQETAGACFEHLRDHVLFAEDGLTGPVPEDFWAQIEAIAGAAEPGSGGLIFTPWLYGERAPVADNTIRAGFHNLSLRSGRAQIIRSVYEGVAFNNKWLLRYIERFIGKRCEPIRYIGGGATSSLWCQIMADVLDREIHQVVEPRACNSRGAALLASIGLGHLQVEDIPSRVGVAQSFEPRPDSRELLDRQFEAFLDIYKRNAPIHRRLNQV